MTADEVGSVDIHVTTHDGKTCYSIYITVDTVQMEYVIHGRTGDILHSGKGSHSH